MRHLTPADYLDMPWKDGGGVTTQLHIHPEGATVAGGFGWRLSMARVARGGPFSRFEGYDRHLALLEGAGMALRLEGGIHRLDAPLRPLGFPGEAEVSAELLGGPCLDFNLIACRARFRSRLMAFSAGALPDRLPEAPIRAAFTPTGDVEVGGRALAPRDLILSEGEDLLIVRGSGGGLLLGLLWPL